MSETRFSRWLTEECKRAELNYTGLGRLAGVKANTARAWCLGESEPQPENVKALARVFGVSVAYLFTLLDWLPEERLVLSEEKERLIQKLHEVPDEELDHIEAQIDVVLRHAESRGERG